MSHVPVIVSLPGRSADLVSLTNPLGRARPQSGEPLLDIRPKTPHLVRQREGRLRGADGKAAAAAPRGGGARGGAVAELEEKEEEK